MASPDTARLAGAVAQLVDATLRSVPEDVDLALAEVEHRGADIEPRRGVPLRTTISLPRFSSRST